MAERLPSVSILMVARNSEAFISAAITSARRQSFTDIEIVVIDDGSTDSTLALAERHAREDIRVRVLPGPACGLAAVRNASLRAARGRYGLVLDSDDLLRIDHVEGMLKAATASKAAMVISNMMVFEQQAGSQLFAADERWAHDGAISMAAYFENNRLYGAGPALGYMKPLFDMNFLRDHALAYNPDLRIGEDFDLVVRGLLAGGSLHYLATPSYLYRRHGASTSHRLSLEDLRALMVAGSEYALPATPEIRAAAARWRASLRLALYHGEAVTAFKQRHWGAAVYALGFNARVWALLFRSAREGVFKRLRRYGMAQVEQACAPIPLRGV